MIAQFHRETPTDHYRVRRAPSTPVSAPLPTTQSPAIAMSAMQWHTRDVIFRTPWLLPLLALSACNGASGEIGAALTNDSGASEAGTTSVGELARSGGTGNGNAGRGGDGNGNGNGKGGKGGN